MCIYICIYIMTHLIGIALPSMNIREWPHCPHVAIVPCPWPTWHVGTNKMVSPLGHSKNLDDLKYHGTLKLWANCWYARHIHQRQVAKLFARSLGGLFGDLASLQMDEGHDAVYNKNNSTWHPWTPANPKSLVCESAILQQLPLFGKQAS
jgi:hypothetical protein